jgi:hypothetical protein
MDSTPTDRAAAAYVSDHKRETAATERVCRTSSTTSAKTLRGGARDYGLSCGYSGDYPGQCSERLAADRDLSPERAADQLLRSQRNRPHHNGPEPIEHPCQFYILPGTGPVGERFLPNRTVQDLEKVIATRNQFYISTGTGPVGERFLAADGDDL